MEVGEELRDFSGVLSGEFEYHGAREPLLDAAGAVRRGS